MVRPLASIVLVALVLTTLAAACGARTGLDTPPPTDAAIDAFRPRDAALDVGRDAPPPDGCTATLEHCDGLDEDCDGVADDGIPCWTLDGAPIGVVPTSVCAAEWYAYDNPAQASANPPAAGVRVSGRVAVAIVETPTRCGGGAIAVIADEVEDGSGGELSAAFTFDRVEGGVLVSDDGPECSYDASSRRGACGWRWQACCTDGVMLGPFTGAQCVELTVSGPGGGAPVGVSELVVLDGLTAARAVSFGVPHRLCRSFEPAR